jgi:hypothetical protein
MATALSALVLGPHDNPSAFKILSKRANFLAVRMSWFHAAIW